MSKNKSDDRLAILAVDPGRTTGIAAAYVPRRQTLKESLLAATHKKAVEVVGKRPGDEITYMEDWLLHSRRIYNIMKRFECAALIENEIPAYNIHFVFEDFVLRRKREGGATGDLTSIWVMAGAIGRYDEGVVSMLQIHYQQASLAKGKATNERLKLWGLYEPGSEHRKDAWRHLATLADKLL